MKKTLVALLAAAAVFGLVACSNDDEEVDVNVVSTVKTTNTYYYTVTGTYTGTDSTAHTLKEVKGTVSWNTNVNSNLQEYDLYATNLHYEVTSGTSTDTKYVSTNLWPRYSANSIYAKSGKYYNSDAEDITARFNGKVTDKSFTYTYSDSDYGKLELTFTKL